MIEAVSEQKYLGIIVMDSCHPSEQCVAAAIKANQVMGQIRRSFSCYSKDIMLQIYKTFVHPHLEYAIPVWSPWLQKDIAVLEAIQRRATKMMCNVKGTYEERLQQVQVTILERQRKWRDVIEVFKILKGNWNVDPST